MGRRGRPPYPDILTPRQWEVLDLVRRGLSDQEIADALDLTLGGAKYHVSEILTKLGVSSREEAAAWQPPEGRPTRWGRALALSLAVKIAGAAVVIAAAAGVACSRGARFAQTTAATPGSHPSSRTWRSLRR